MWKRAAQKMASNNESSDRTKMGNPQIRSALSNNFAKMKTRTRFAPTIWMLFFVWFAAGCHKSVNVSDPSALRQIPERLRAAMNSQGEQRRDLFESLLRDYDPH